MKNLFSIILSIIIIISAVPLAIAAEANGFEYSDNGNGTCKIEGIKPTMWHEEEIDIPSVIKTASGELTVTEIAAHAFKQRIFRSVYIPETVQTIGAYAFYNCGKLSEVIMGKSVKTIGDHAFDGCKALISINLKNATSIGEFSFYRCSALTEVDLGSALKTVGSYAFRYCKSLEYIKFSPVIKTIKNNAFEFCTALTSLEIPSTVKSIEAYAFKGCAALEILEFSEGKYSIGACAFQDCPLITQVTIPDTITEIGTRAFTCYDAQANKYLNTIKIRCSLNSAGIAYSIANGCPVYIIELDREISSFGDIDGSGVTDTEDARKLLRLAARLEFTKDEDIYLFGDLNRNNCFDTQDAALILKIAVKIA